MSPETMIIEETKSDNYENKPLTPPGPNSIFIGLIMVGMVTAGSMTTILGKLMD